MRKVRLAGPFVRTHPVSHRKCLFVNENFSTRIEGARQPESDAILEMLYDRIATPEFHCRFAWREKSVAFRDNRCAQHRTVGTITHRFATATE
jgi:taurine dioxygenase